VDKDSAKGSIISKTSKTSKVSK